MQICVLGSGMVGRAIALDLAKDYDVTCIDISAASLSLLTARNHHIRVLEADLTNWGNYPSLLAQYELVVSAVPGFMGYKTLEAVIKCRKNIVDISFFPENALDLSEIAKHNGVTAIVDCGVAPGMSNLLLGYYDQQMKIESFECLVGGLPKQRTRPFEYKAPFSPIDVIEEYLRPARYVENSAIVTKPALSDAELLECPPVGTLQSFNTDGLRSILFTMPHIPNMKEKTLRYPGHIDLIIALKQAGFFDEKEIIVKGKPVIPIDFTAALLFDSWKLQEDELEFTLMKVIMRGSKDGEPICVEYDLYDEYDPSTRISSMSRTTGYTCTAAVNLILKNIFTEKGLFPPELIGGHPGCFEFIMQYLAERNVVYTRRQS